MEKKWSQLGIWKLQKEKISLVKANSQKSVAQALINLVGRLKDKR